jgi:UrcA family protein
MHTSHTFRRLLSAAVLATLAAGVSAAPADARVDAPQVIVKYADLALSSPQGAAVLYQRIWGAALSVCRPLEDGSLRSKQAKDACMHTAIAEAVAKVDRPALYSVYRAKNPEPAARALTAGNR